MSRVALARRTGLSVPTLIRIFEGQANPTIKTLFALAEALGVEFRISGNAVEPREILSPGEFKRAIAERKAKQLVKVVQGTSALEAQAVSQADEEEMVQQTIHDLLSGPPRRLWTP